MADKPVEHAAASGKEISAAGISLTFPNDWTVIDLTKGQFDQAAGAMSKDPNTAQMAQAAQTAARSGMFKMFVFDRNGSKPGFANNMNLVVTPVGKGITLDQALESTKQQLATMNMPVKLSKVTLSSGEFGRIDSHTKTPNGKECGTIGYMFINGSDLGVATFSFNPESQKEYETKSETIMKTLKRA